MLAIILLALPLLQAPVLAQTLTCTSDSTPTTVPSSTQRDFDNYARNDETSDTNIRWVRVTRPSANFTINSAFVGSPWTATVTSSTVTFTGGTITPGGILNFTVTATTGANNAPAASWTTQVADNVNGNNPVTCRAADGGSLSVTISGNDTTAPTISSIATSGITSSAATVTWTTDEGATSQIEYGLTSQYGSQTAVDNRLVSSHSVQLTGLSAGTGYHYRVVSADSSNNTARSSNNTFLTASAPAPSPAPSPAPAPSPTPTPTPSPTPSPTATPTPAPAPGPSAEPSKTLADTTPPTIAITTNLSSPFKNSPLVEGNASDNQAVTKVEYSLDEGRNWLPAQAKGLGKSKVTFSFTPNILEDSNYPLQARASDTAGNKTVSENFTLILDRAPPRVGGNVATSGPVVLSPDSNGVITTSVGIDQRVTLAATGGPTQVVIVATLIQDSNHSEQFTLTKSSRSGLWSGILSFTRPGTYTLMVKATDGAQNNHERPLNPVQVLEPGKVIERSDTSIGQATVTLYYREPISKIWTVWDGAPYGQKNPQPVRPDGTFSYFLPSGSYYLAVLAKGYRPAVTEVFNLTNPAPLTPAIALKKLPGLGKVRLPLPWPTVSRAGLTFPSQDLPQELITNPAEGKPLPESFVFTDSATRSVNPVLLRGKPTVLSTFTTWSPASAELLSALAELQKNPDLNIVPIAPMESPEKVKAYLKVGGYELSFIPDPDGATLDTLQFSAVPTHYLVNRKGVVKKVVVGVLSKQEILNLLTQL